MIPSIYLPLLDGTAKIPEDVRALDDQIGTLMSLRKTHKHDLILCRGVDLHRNPDAVELRVIEKAIAVRLAELDRHVLETADLICDEKFAEYPDRNPTITSTEIVCRMYDQPTYSRKFPKSFRSYFNRGRVGRSVRVYKILRESGRYEKMTTKMNATTYVRTVNGEVCSHV